VLLLIGSIEVSRKLSRGDFGDAQSCTEPTASTSDPRGGSYAGAPAARGVIQLREVRQSDGKQETVWVIRRETNTIQLDSTRESQ
jgi:hypothetical protein